MFKNSIKTTRTPVRTPLGEFVFLMSHRDREGIPEHSAIVTHTETGVMALSICKSMDGDSSKRMASADAAYDLCMTVQAVKNKTSEACV